VQLLPDACWSARWCRTWRAAMYIKHCLTVIVTCLLRRRCVEPCVLNGAVPGAARRCAPRPLGLCIWADQRAAAAHDAAEQASSVHEATMGSPRHGASSPAPTGSLRCDHRNTMLWQVRLSRATRAELCSLILKATLRRLRSEPSGRAAQKAMQVVPAG
jgi:hypothetical protein